MLTLTLTLTLTFDLSTQNHTTCRISHDRSCLAYAYRLSIVIRFFSMKHFSSRSVGESVSINSGLEFVRSAHLCGGSGGIKR